MPVTADRETIIDTGGSGDGGFDAGMIVALVAIVLVLVASGYLVFHHSGSNSVTIDLPKVTVAAPK